MDKMKLDAFFEWQARCCSTNLKFYKNLGALGFDCKKVALQAQNENRCNIRCNGARHQFNYDIAAVLTVLPEILRNQKYVRKLDHQLGTVLIKYPQFSKKIKKLFEASFANAGFEMALCEFFVRRGIRILELEPAIPDGENKCLDILIELNGRRVFVELNSPIDRLINCVLRGKNAVQTLVQVIDEKTKDQLAYVRQPAILAINLSDPEWSRNGFNDGRVTDQMFYCIKETIRLKRFTLPDALSLLLIKYGPQLYYDVNNDAAHPLTDREIKKLTCIPSWKRALDLLRCRN